MSSLSLLRPDEVPNELICAICFSIPLRPKLLPCEHVFCTLCVHRALETQPSCPTCRTPCDQNQPKDLSSNPFAFRIWNSIQVKCDQSESGCAWTGAISDLESHRQKCSAGNKTNIDQEELGRLRQENIRLNDEIKRLKEVNRQALNATFDFAKMMLDENDVLPKIDYSNYSFNRHNVVKLSQLISRYLENKPSEINSHRIYNCVQSCYRALENGYSNNPKHYDLDMHMLLTTCAASTWFSKKQMGNIRRWIRSHW